MFHLSDFYGFLFASAAHEAAVEEQRERQESVDKFLADYDREQEEEKQFYKQLEEQHKREVEQEERDWYDREREQLVWEMRNAELYGFDKENIQSRMDWLNDQEGSD